MRGSRELRDRSGPARSCCGGHRPRHARAVPGRTVRQRHRGRHAARRAVRRPVRTRRHAGLHFERAAVRALPGRIAAPALPARHRGHRTPMRSRQCRRGRGLPPAPARKGAAVPRCAAAGHAAAARDALCRSLRWRQRARREGWSSRAATSLASRGRTRWCGSTSMPSATDRGRSPITSKSRATSTPCWSAACRRWTTTLDNPARRFIALVDEFYDRGVKLVLAAHAPVDELYVGDRLQFEFDRTRSRLGGNADARVPGAAAPSLNWRRRCRNRYNRKLLPRTVHPP